MGEERKSKSNSVIPNVAALKKAGLTPGMMIIVTVLSSPGIWQAFFDRGASDAQRKAEVAYEVLVNEVKHLREDDESMREELQRLRDAVLKLSLRGTRAKVEARQMAVEAAEEVVVSKRRRGKARKKASKPDVVKEPEAVEILRNASPPKTAKTKKDLPKNLDMLMEQKAF